MTPARRILLDWLAATLAAELRSQIERGARPTAEQIETLDEIGEKATARG